MTQQRQRRRIGMRLFDIGLAGFLGFNAAVWGYHKISQDERAPETEPAAERVQASWEVFLEEETPVDIVGENHVSAAAKKETEERQGILENRIRQDIVRMTDAACEDYGKGFPKSIDCPSFMLAVFSQESDLHPYATSPYAAGIAQFSAETAQVYDLKLLEIPEYYDWQQAQDTRYNYKYVLGMKRQEKMLISTEESAEYQRLKREEKNAWKQYSAAVQEFALQKIKEGKADELAALDDRYVPEKAIPAAVREMSRLLHDYNGNKESALNAYNWGQKNVDKCSPCADNKLPKETRNHEERILEKYDSFLVSAANR